MRDPDLPPDIETRQLREVEALARLGSFAAAAGELGLSQPALTRSIQRLERRVGAALFARHSRGVRPTPLGERFLQRARALLSGIADLGRELELLQGAEEDVLRLGIGPSVRGPMLPRALRRVWLDRRKLRVEVRPGGLGELANALLERNIDLCLAERRQFEADPRFQVQPLRGEKLVWVAHPEHDLASRPPSSRRRIHLSELEAHPMALPRLADLIPAAPLERSREWRMLAALESDDSELLISLALHGAAVSMLPRSAVREELRRGRLVALHVLPPMPETRPGAVWLRDRTLSPAGRVLVSLLPREASKAGE